MAVTTLATIFVHMHKPKILFLSETKKKSRDMELIRVRWGFHGYLFVDSISNSGGLALFWLSDVNSSIESYSFNHIDLYYY